MPFSPKLVRIARRLLISLAVFATSLALIVVVENWRGDRAWKRYAAEHAARGEILDALPSPSTLSSEVNFFKTPVIERWIFDQHINNFRNSLRLPALDNTVFVLKDWRNGRAPDFKGIVEALQKKQKMSSAPEDVRSTAVTPAGQIIEILAPIESVLLELRQASKQRPESQLARPAAFSRDPYLRTNVNFAFARVIGPALGLHASASLTERNYEIAFDDILAGLKFSRGLSNAPDVEMIELMIGTILLKPMLQPIWQGLQQHEWSGEQLLEIQQEIGRFDLFMSLDQVFHTERAKFLNDLDYVPLSDDFYRSKDRWKPPMIPRGWIQQNKVRYCQLSAHVFPIIAANGTPDFLTKLSRAGKYPEGFGPISWPYTFVDWFGLFAPKRALQEVTSTQAYLTLAQTACALERHWLAHGKYPGSLAELVPAYLAKVPTDIIDGQPLHYGRTDKGKFILYSIGLDGKDDGGKLIDPKQTNDSPGDWAWPQLVEN